jgi:hypothetical protein
MRGRWFIGYDAHTIAQGAITLSEVAEMKRIGDRLFIRASNPRIQNRAARQKNDG